MESSGAALNPRAKDLLSILLEQSGSMRRSVVKSLCVSAAPL